MPMLWEILIFYDRSYRAKYDRGVIYTLWKSLELSGISLVSGKIRQFIRTWKIVKKFLYFAL